MKHILIISFFLVFFFSFSIFAQEDGQWTHYPVTDELHLEYVSTLTTDKNDVLWAGTVAGLYRFDGENWGYYSFEEIEANSQISSLVVDDNTLHVVAGAYNTFRDNAWSGQIKDKENEYLPNGYNPTILSIAPNGDAWFGASAGVLHYDGSSWDYFLIDDGFPVQEIESIAVDMSGNVWCGTLQKGLLRFDGETWTQFTEENGLGGEYEIKVKVGPDGTVWCAGKKLDKEGVSDVWIARYLGGNNWMILDHSVQIDMLEVDSNGVLWAGNPVEIFSSYDGINWTKYNLPYPPDIAILSFAVDTKGVVWIGTHENGIYRFDTNPTVVEYTIPSPKSFSITGNYPNPFNGSTIISFQAPESAYCELSIYSINGQLINTLISSNINQGGHQVYWNGKDADDQTVASGMYFVRMQMGTGITTHKVTFMK